MSTTFDFLEKLKGTALDLSHIELIKHAYELQEKALKQQKENNEALQQGNQLLKEKVDRLNSEIAQLKKRAESAEAQLKNAEKIIEGHKKTRTLSELEVKILKLLAEIDGDERNNWVESKNVAENAKVPIAVVKIAYQNLLNRNFVAYVPLASHDGIYIQDLGRRYLQEKGLLDHNGVKW